MELLKFGKDQRFNDLNDLMKTVPYSDEWDCALGHFINDRLAITAIGKTRKDYELNRKTHIGYANSHMSDYNEYADSIVEQIFLLDDEIVALIITESCHNQNEDYDYEYYIQLEKPDWKVLKERLIEKINKADRDTLTYIAYELEVDIY
jgi:hypothetical protein